MSLQAGYRHIDCAQRYGNEKEVIAIVFFFSFAELLPNFSVIFVHLGGSEIDQADFYHCGCKFLDLIDCVPGIFFT